MRRQVKTEYPRLKGVLELWVYDGEGELKAHYREDNLVVDTGRQLMATYAATAVNRVGVGTNGAAGAPGDVAPLAEQYAKAFSGVTQPDARTVVFGFTIGTTEFNGKTIREFGLLRLVGETYTLFARRGGYEIPRTADDQVQGTWTVTF